jgi:hypothetical protein
MLQREYGRHNILFLPIIFGPIEFHLLRAEIDIHSFINNLTAITCFDEARCKGISEQDFMYLSSIRCKMRIQTKQGNVLLIKINYRFSLLI